MPELSCIPGLPRLTHALDRMSSSVQLSRQPSCAGLTHQCDARHGPVASIWVCRGMAEADPVQGELLAELFTANMAEERQLVVDFVLFAMSVRAAPPVHLMMRSCLCSHRLLRCLTGCALEQGSLSARAAGACTGLACGHVSLPGHPCTLRPGWI